MEGDEDKGRRQRPQDEAAGSNSAGGDVEEEQVEKFFALLKSIRKMRELRRRTGGGVPTKRTRVEGAAAWTPTFQWEDFAGTAAESGDNPEVRLPAASQREGGRRGKEKKEEEGTSHLDLRLSL